MRTGSSRLPAKALMPILGKPMLEQMVERIQRSRHIDQIVIATTELKEDDRLEALADRLGLGCFRGSENDVLGRMKGAVESANADLVVELLGDNPLVHGDLIDEVIEFQAQGGFDYAVNVTHEQPYAPKEVKKFPIGIRVEVYKPEVIVRSAAGTSDPHHREHSTSYIAQHPDIFALGYFQASGKWAPVHRPELTFAVNYQQNFDLITHIFEACYPRDVDFSLLDAMSVFNAEPHLISLMGAPTGT